MVGFSICTAPIIFMVSMPCSTRQVMVGSVKSLRASGTCGAIIYVWAGLRRCDAIPRKGKESIEPSCWHVSHLPKGTPALELEILVPHGGTLSLLTKAGRTIQSWAVCPSQATTWPGTSLRQSWPQQEWSRYHLLSEDSAPDFVQPKAHLCLSCVLLPWLGIPHLHPL